MGSTQRSGNQKEQISMAAVKDRVRLRRGPRPRSRLRQHAGSSSNGKPHAGETLLLAANVVHANLTLAEGQEWLAGRIAREFGVEAGALMLVHDGQGDLLVQRSGEANPAWYYGVRLAGEGSLFGQWLKETVISPGSPENREPEFSECLGELGRLPSVGLPLRSNGQTLGLLALFGRPEIVLNPETGALLELIAGSAAHTLYQLRQIQQLRVANATLEANHWQLLRSRNTLRALFDSIPTSIYIVDRKYNLAAINLNRSNLTVSPPNELVGRRCYEALYGREDVCADCRIVETLFGGRSTARTRRHWKTDEDPQEWDISTYPISDEAGNTLQAIVLEQDVTEKRRLEATLAQSEKLAAVGQLAAGLAHEINNPLTAIIANAQILQRELPPEDDKQELVDLIARAGDRATRVVRNLLDLARKEQYEFAPTDLNESIRKALALLQHEFVSRSVRMVIELAPDLPQIKASENHLQGVWVNLITNAMDALEAEPNEIRILTRRQGNEVRVTVSDSGKGMAPERLSRIFEPFYTTKGPGRGTGLGLSVCHRVLKQHGGRIIVDSQLGIGTQFTVVLPVA
jgi:two-component system NtrC family sensor kinase